MAWFGKLWNDKVRSDEVWIFHTHLDCYGKLQYVKLSLGWVWYGQVIREIFKIKYTYSKHEKNFSKI